MNIKMLTLGAYQTNCYLAWAENSKTCAVIDPGYQPETVLSQVQELGLTVEAILLTHGHFDHVGAVEALERAANCAVWMHQADCPHSPNPILRQFFPLSGREIPNLHFFAQGQAIQAGELTFTVYETPGHTPGSVCLACGGALFSGDTLFSGSCGRTDLPGGDPQAMERSLASLTALDFSCRIFPGHGESTTLAEEKRYNPYLKRASVCHEERP